MAESTSSFAAQIEALDGIVAEAKQSSTTLERSLDLLEEAVALGLSAVELVDTAALSADELAEVDASDASDAQPDLRPEGV